MFPYFSEFICRKYNIVIDFFKPNNENKRGIPGGARPNDDNTEKTVTYHRKDTVENKSKNASISNDKVN